MSIRKCENCQYSSSEDFKEVVNLKSSGLIIYIHDNKSKQKRNYSDHSRSNIILHNTSNRDIKRFDYIVELCQYRTKCLKCKMLIQRVRSIIDDITVINKNEVIGVCDYCKRSLQRSKCKRCQYIVEKFVNNKTIQNEIRDQKFKLMLSKLQQILLFILETKVVCRHNIRLDFEYQTHLNRLLNSLNSPIPTRQPEIDSFPNLFDLKEIGGDISTSRQILEDLVKKLKYKEICENANADLDLSSSTTESECICKYFGNNNKKHKPGLSAEIVREEKISLSKLSVAKEDENETTLITSSDHQKHYKSNAEPFTEKSSTEQKLKLMETLKKTHNRILKTSEENDISKEKTDDLSKKIANELSKKKKTNDLSKKTTSDLLKKTTNDLSKKKTSDRFKKIKNDLSKEKPRDSLKEIKNDQSKEKSNVNLKKGTQKVKKENQNPEYSLMLQMLKDREREKKTADRLENIKIKQVLPSIKELPVVQLPIRKMHAENLEVEKSESILECKDQNLDIVKEMIKGTKIVDLDPHYRDNIEKLPRVFKIKTGLTKPTNNKQPVAFPIAKSAVKIKKLEKENSMIHSGVIRYELSNREFIDKGWTKLPTTKIMRRMNIYKMVPASDKFDWFQNNKKQEYLFYNTGEKFAEINGAGGGKWFYKNGNVALHAHSAKDSNRVKRYVVYSSGEECVNKKKEPITILACFDSFGNGVVYDCYGNVRLKYNQSEGVLMDKKISAPGRWKWHTLNDPPVLQQVYLDTYDSVENHVSLNDLNTAVDNIKVSNEEMIAIELDNFVKEKAHKLMQKFKPFQIRIKVLKINNFFSLRIVDQANIILLFRCDGIVFKIAIGMLLKSDEIVDTDISEVSEVSTPYDKHPPRSPSLTNIRNILSNVRKHYGRSNNNI